MWKKMTALVLCLCLVFALVVPSFAANRSLLRYRSVAFLGDSISLGYTQKVGYNKAYSTFDDDYVLSEEATSMVEIGKGNPYPTAYPYVFGQLAGICPEKVYNYGISGAMAADIAVMLKYTPQEYAEELIKINDNSFGMNFLRNGFINAFSPDEEASETTLNPIKVKFADNMKERIKSSDLVAIALGGNDIYQNLLMEQFKTLFSGWMPALVPGRDLGTLGTLVTIITLLMQFEAPLSYLEGLGEWFNFGGDDNNDTDGTQKLSTTAAQAGPFDADGISSILGGLGDELKKMIEFYSADAMKEIFLSGTASQTSILEGWKASYKDIVETILKQRYYKGDIALISQYNPFGVENYLQFLTLKWEKEQLKDDLGLDVNTALRAVRTLINELTGTKESVGSSGWMKMAVKALQTALDKCLPTIDVDKDNDSLYELIADVAYPVMVLMIGNSLQPIYDEMNDFLKDLAKLYSGVYFVDISDAPSSGRMDPHPGADMHEWIAQRIYDSLVASKYYLPAPTSTVKVMVSSVKTVVKLAKNWSSAAQSGTGATPVNTSIMQQFLNVQKTFWGKLFQMPLMKLVQN